MDMKRIFVEESISLGENITNSKDILKAIAALASKNKDLENVNEKDIFTALKEREALSSTGLTKGIAIPHCSLEDTQGFALGILTLSEAIDFNSIDGEKSDIFIFLIGDMKKRNTHIKLLSQVASMLKQEDKRSILRSNYKSAVVSMVNEMLQSFDKSNEANGGERAILHIFIQDEAAFSRIMEIFSGSECCYINVLETNPASSYFQELPLFASFWNPPDATFNRIIFAVIPRALSNKMLGQLDKVISGLEDRNGVLVVMNEVSYFNGSIGF